ncbi:MAG: dihydrofolate reductase family protein [Anaerolineae bacterium]|nr:dihydrofolate reductase family protein [Anaerolineae bacterium]
MGKVILAITMSLDGFVTGPNDSPSNPLGDHGERLFEWYRSGDTDVPMPDGLVLKVSAESADLIKQAFRETGAMVAGREMFDVADAWGGHPPFSPCFILTHHPPAEWIKPDSPFTFVTDGIESAIRQAKQAAGEKNVAISTASVMQQCLKAGLLDEIHIDLAPVLLGSGTRLFEHLGVEPIALERTQAVATPDVTHLTFRVIK